MTLKYQVVKGFTDLLPPETRLWEKVERRARDILAVYGFEEIRLPVLEYTELFSRSIGADTDIVEKEMFTFPDKKGRSLTLRPEATASVVRAYIEHNLGKSGPVKLYYLGPMFRYERPQKGRYRQFWQIGAETIGLTGPASDAELIMVLRDIFEAFEISGVSLEINSIGCPECRPAYREKLIGFLRDREGELCKDCQRRLNENPLRVLDCKNDSCRKATTGAPRTLDSLCSGCDDHFRGLKSNLELLGVAYTINPNIVRGLDYYTRTVFEYLATDKLGAQNAVAAGGRYDGLIGGLGGTATPAAGFALGMERLIMLVPKGARPASAEKIYIVTMGDEAFREGLGWASALRDAGFAAELSEGSGGLKKQLKAADRMKASHVMIIGEDEIKKGVVTVRDMASSKQIECNAREFKKALAAKEKSDLPLIIKNLFQGIITTEDHIQER